MSKMIVVTSIIEKQPNHQNKIIGGMLYDCLDCKGHGTKLKGCQPLANRVEGVKFPVYIPNWIYVTCDTCNGKGMVDDLLPDYQMD